jgi:diadenosine tetraphosphatase ApaH/serine/threonine PP2A family protein phosphatase
MRGKRYAIFGDIHGNQEALEAVMEDAVHHDATAFVSVGDIVGYNANPAECLETIRRIGCVSVRGNHDHYCSHLESLDDFHPLAANVVDWTRQALSTEQIQYLRELPLSVKAQGFTLVHSTLDMPEKWGYVFDTLEADANFSYQTTAVCFHGHTHVPVVYEKDGRAKRLPFMRFAVVLGRKYFINVGSVGQPRDGDHRAAYVLYDVDNKEIELIRVRYDIQKAQDKIRQAGLPDRLARRLEKGQ